MKHDLTTSDPICRRVKGRKLTTKVFEVHFYAFIVMWTSNGMSDIRQASRTNKAIYTFPFIAQFAHQIATKVF